ncbi:MAG: sigma 54-interacting transcriptional regulator [Planctomycetes bacterium]|nr:sigma 54-interacting transcriptional regulator [Planctomycetota bacterium]
MDLDFRRAPQILADVADAMADGLFTVDAQGRFVSWSAGAERITGYSEDDVRGRPCELLEGENCKGFASLRDVLADPTGAGDGIMNQECKVLSKDGHERYLNGNVRLLFEYGQVAGAVGTFTDLTSFVLAHQRLHQLEDTERARGLGPLVGESPPMQDVFRRIRLAGRTEVTVLIRGESGTGKELCARAIHDASERANRPFVAINCAAIPEALLESELFGHKRGAFTGAVRDHPGLFRAADGGTLFLDEIGELSPHLQLKLLRVLETRHVLAVGAETDSLVDVRLITATHRDLEARVREGELREDFFYRIRVFEIEMPPLRERVQDLPLLVDHLLAEFTERHGRKLRGVANDAMQRLRAHSWPGNVRELRNVLEHAVVTAGGDRIGLLDLPREIRRPRTSAAEPLERPLTEREQAEARRIRAALEAEGWHRQRAAERLSTSRMTLWKKIKRYRLEPPAPGTS